MRDPFPYLSIAASLLLLLLTPPLWAAVSLGAVAALALMSRLPRREARTLAAGLLLAASILVAGLAMARFSSGPAWTRFAERRLDALLDRLETGVETARAEVGDPPASPRRIEAFDRLGGLAARDGGEWSYLLFDPDGEAVAWAGEGLLHDVDPLARGREETGFVSSYTATTLYALRAVGEAPNQWWILAGRSFPRDRLPFPAGPLLDRQEYRWWLEPDPAARDLDRGGGEAVVDARVLRSGRGFAMRLVHEPEADPGRRARDWAAVALGVALLLAALDRGRWVVRAEGAATGSGPALAPALAAIAGVAALAYAGGATLAPLAVLGVAALLASIWWWWWRSFGRGEPWLWPRALCGAAFPLGAAWLAQGFDLPLDLGERLGSSGAALAYRTAMVVLALAVLAPVVASDPGGRPRRYAPLLGASLPMLLLAGALGDHTLVAAILLVAGGTAAIVALQKSAGPPAGRWLALVVVACLLGAVSWEISFRYGLRSRWEQDIHRMAGPVLDARASALNAEMEAFLASPEAREIVSIPTSPGAGQDLAVALWRRSPLARRDVASAVQVDGGGAEPSIFSYGLTIREGEVDPESLPPPGVRADRWIDGGATLVGRERSKAVLFWIIPLAVPAAGATFEELEVDLLRGGPAVEGVGLPGGAALAVHEGDLPVVRPWPRMTPPERGDKGVASTPDGPAWYWSERYGDTTYTVYLPRLGPLAGLERVGINAVGSLLAAAVLTALGLLLVLGDETFRLRIEYLVRSYSRRLILILTVLIVLPMLLLDAVLVRVLDQRLETEHRAAAEVALKVSQRVLSDYLLALEPGFGIRTVLEQDVLDWLAKVVDREVNVYWGSQSFASSRPELFTAGLLPTRIPGDVFSELALRQDALAARTRSAAGHTYVELYGSLDVAQPDVPLDRRFYLSTPLLVQEEEVGVVLARLGRRVAVVTVALLLLVLAVGARLAAGFTRPVMEIVDGTDRIAGGATSLGLDPTEPELRTLVRAIDEMARRIAQGRADLLREKQVIEKMVESITAAVVSLDQDHRVIMHNHVAATLLGVEVGAPIARVAAAAPIVGLASFLSDAGGAVAPLQRRLRSAGGEDREWSVLWVPVPGGGDPAALLVVEDVTEILRAQRLEAWAEMARIIAHEVKNPLTPIRLSTEHMQRVFASDPEHFREVFERCTRNILLQVEELRVIATEFSTYSSVPSMDPRPGDLVALARSVTGSYQIAPPPGVGIDFDSTASNAPARFDSKLLTRVLRNLLENAVRASHDHGKVEVRVRSDASTVTIEVSDHGPGVRAEDMARIFEPYFSTYDTGTGLGLPIARRIVEMHGGTIAAANRVGGGLSVRVTLPVAETQPT